MPFGSPFVSAMKEAPPAAESPAPNGFVPQPQPPAPNAFASLSPSAAPGNAPASSGMAKLGFAAVLDGYSVEELGFNPTTLPAWITTSVQASALREQIASGNVVLELGLLIDGISDFGFRNTLSSAKRDFKIKLPQNEVFHSLTNMSAAPAAAASFGSPSPAAAPAPARFSVQPNPQQQQPEQNSQPMFAAASPPAPAEPQPPSPMFSAAAALTPFTQSQPAAAASPISAFGTPSPAGAPAQFEFSPPAAPAETAPTPAPAAFSFPSAQPAAASPSKPLQPLSGAFQSFGASLSPSVAPQSSPLAGTVKPFDPFASSSTGPHSGKGPAESGFSSAQLLGQVPPPQPPAPSFAPAPEAKPAPSLFATPAPAPFQPPPSFAPALEEIPSFSTPAVPAPQPASRGLFSASSLNVPLFSESPASQPRPEPKFAPAAPAMFKSPAAQASPPAAAPSKMTAVKHSFLGLSPLDTQTDQLLLRALLGTEEKLTAPRVVELLALQPGLSACVCLHGSQVLSHADLSKEDAVEFQRQAPDIARQLRGLAPLIGIEGAETFTLNAGGRLLTFCFPGESIIGVLHDDEPSTGMRDKITLIARELARMLD
ncbi:MAG: hypothetical protein ACYC67_13160 [Prosthecobacter sp.]